MSTILTPSTIADLIFKTTRVHGEIYWAVSINGIYISNYFILVITNIYHCAGP